MEEDVVGARCIIIPTITKQESTYYFSREPSCRVRVLLLLCFCIYAPFALYVHRVYMSFIFLVGLVVRGEKW